MRRARVPVGRMSRISNVCSIRQGVSTASPDLLRGLLAPAMLVLVIEAGAWTERPDALGHDPDAPAQHDPDPPEVAPAAEQPDAHQQGVDRQVGGEAAVERLPPPCPALVKGPVRPRRGTGSVPC